MVFESNRGNAAPFTFGDLLESRIIKGFKYREVWAQNEWRSDGDLMSTRKEHNQEYNELHEYMAWHGRVMKDKHQSFLVELKQYDKEFRHTRLYVFFHDWSILIGTKARVGDLGGHKVIDTKAY